MAPLSSCSSLHPLSSLSPPSSSSSNTRHFLPQLPPSKPEIPSLPRFSFINHNSNYKLYHRQATPSLLFQPQFLLGGLDAPLDTQTALSIIIVFAAIALSLFLGLKVICISFCFSCFPSFLAFSFTSAGNLVLIH